MSLFFGAGPGVALASGMLALDWGMVAGAISAAALFVALCGAAPAAISVHLLTRARSAAPLARGALEHSGTLGAALVASIAALAWMRAWFGAASGGGSIMLALAHPIIAVAPWAAGELLSGPSRRRIPSLFAAIGVSGAASWLLVSRDLSAEPGLAHLAADALAVGLCAAGTYLVVRGTPTYAENQGR